MKNYKNKYDHIEPDFKPKRFNVNALEDRSPYVEVPPDRFCEKPFVEFRLDSVYNENAMKVNPCCGGWHNKSFGRYKDFNSVEEIINSDHAKAFRESILDGSFRFCNKNVCPRIISKTIYPLQKKEDIDDPYLKDIIENNIIEVDHLRNVSFDWDPSCNLQCPSCRSEKIQHKKGTGPYNKLKKIQDDVLEFVFKNAKKEDPMVFNITSTGDAIGSTLYREWLTTFDGTNWPNLKLDLMTNGVLLNKHMWKKLSKVHNNIRKIDISMDAGNKESYDKIRVGGNWDVLIKNINHLAEESIKIGFKLRLMCVVQYNNYRSLPELIRLAEDLEGVDEVLLNRVFNWGHWNHNEYMGHAIWRSDHPEHSDFKKVFSDPIFRSKKVVDKVNYDKNTTL